MQLIYRISLALYYGLIRLAALAGHAKAQAWIDGRRDWLSTLDRFRAQRSEVPLIWMHCASLGEFEQGRPVLEALRQEHPDHLIALTFYSPSGFEARKHFSGADWVGYLPLDTPREARLWVAALRPNLAIFVKYEFWHYHLAALARQAIPIALIAGSFRATQPFFQSYGAFFRRTLARFSLLAVQTERDRDLLDDLHLPGRIIVTGDPRVDRTLTISRQPFQDPVIGAFAAERPVLIAGSTWPADEEVLAQLLPRMPAKWKLILVPHELTEAHLRALDARFPDALRYTAKPDSRQLSATRVLILDTMGLLNKVYRYGRIAYIGGGFGVGIHNTLEAMAYGLPVIFGPKHQKFPEAVQAVKRGAAFAIKDATGLIACFQHLLDEPNHARSQAAVTRQMQASAGAARLTYEALSSLFLPAGGTDSST